jgi:hypothetical protein
MKDASLNILINNDNYYYYWLFGEYRDRDSGKSVINVIGNSDEYTNVILEVPDGEKELKIEKVGTIWSFFYRLCNPSYSPWILLASYDCPGSGNLTEKFNLCMQGIIRRIGMDYLAVDRNQFYLDYVSIL